LNDLKSDLAECKDTFENSRRVEMSFSANMKGSSSSSSIPHQGPQEGPPSLSSPFLQGPSLNEIENCLAGLSAEEMEQVLGVVQRDMQERTFQQVNRSDSFNEVVLKQVPIVNTSDEELEEVEEIGSGLVVNPNGHYERFDEINLEEEEENKEDKEEEESELSLVLNELPECERNHIVDVMCRELEMEIANQQKISRLRAELAMLRRKGVMKVGTDWTADPSRSCGRCRAELGRIINRGAVCRGCSIRVCKNCRDFSQGQDWLCPVCRKNNASGR